MVFAPVPPPALTQVGGEGASLSGAWFALVVLSYVALIAITLWAAFKLEAVTHPSERSIPSGDGAPSVWDTDRVTDVPASTRTR